jgi:hypothetical protein
MLRAEGSDEGPEIHAGGGIEAGGRFVKEQDFRICEEALGDFNAALLTTGESLDECVEFVVEVEGCREGADTGGERLAVEAVERAAVAEVFAGGEFFVEAGGLKDDADLLAHGGGVAHHITPAHACCA